MWANSLRPYIHLLRTEGGQQNPSEPIGRGRMERSAPAREVQLSDFVKMMVFDRSYMWGQVTAITGTRRALKSFSGMKMTRNWHHIWGKMKLKSSAAAHFTCWWAAWPHQSHNHTVSRGEQSLQQHKAQLLYPWGVMLVLCFGNDVVKKFQYLAWNLSNQCLIRKIGFHLHAWNLFPYIIFLHTGGDFLASFPCNKMCVLVQQLSCSLKVPPSSIQDLRMVSNLG